MKHVLIASAKLLTFLIGIYSANVAADNDEYPLGIFRYEGKYPKIEVKRNCSFVSNLSPYQKEVMDKIYYIAKPYDLHLTAIAIAWKESKLGKYKVRMGTTKYDRSFGIMHTVSYWKTVGMTPFEKGLLIQDLILDDVKSITVGLEDLLYWQQVAGWDWYKGVAMYNAGSAYKNGLGYADGIAVIVKELMVCGL